MSTKKSSGGKKFVTFREPGDPPPRDPFFGGSFDYIEGGETSNHRHRGYRHKEQDGGGEKECSPFATVAKERRKYHESPAIPLETIAEIHREQTRCAAPQPAVPLSSARRAPSGHSREESDTGSYVRERPAYSEHGRGESVVRFAREPSAPSELGREESDTGSYVRERPAPSEHGRGERVVTFREPIVSCEEPSAPSRRGYSENGTGSYGRERPAPSEHGGGERVATFREQPAPSRYGCGKNDIVSYVRKRPAPSEQDYGERVVSLKERPVPSRYGRGVRDVVYNTRRRPAPNSYGRGESDIVFYIREGPAPGQYGRGKRVVSYGRERPAPSKHGHGESHIVTYIIERPAAEQPQKPDAHQIAGGPAPSLNQGRDSGLPAWRAPSPVRRKPAPSAGNQLVGNQEFPPTLQRNLKPKETPNQDHRGLVQPEQRLYKRVGDPPSLAGFLSWISPPYSCKKSIDFPPPRDKFEMSGALTSPPPVKMRRPRLLAKSEALARNDDIVRTIRPPRCEYEMSGALEPLPPSMEVMRRPRSPAKRASNGDIIVCDKHRGNRHSGNSNSDGSKSSVGRRCHTIQINQNLNVVLERQRGRRGEGGVNAKVKD